MNIDIDAIDEVVLALLYLSLHDQLRAWKGLGWEALNRLHERGLISNPVSKSKSVTFSVDGLREAERLFKQYFLSDGSKAGQ
ncbi:DUF6429 family protein [Pseudomonas aeruginosa]|uniref:DUF6429 domain-containing protein n=1 Tax=Pseudomonas aeruginosa TaxID=287 RepID=A0A6A9JXV5_PSEAI|nr:DUF6429 family protein [Pseudomonas aeruginosa]MUI60085.1 hypothetical protein [Pseudomonas aeruginosa]